MDMRVYRPDGYLDFEYIAKRSSGARVWLIGARGIGKTYAALHFLLDAGKPFLYMRRTQKQLRAMTKDYFNPFKDMMPDYFINVEAVGEGEGRFYTGDPKDKDSQITRGLMLSLSGVAALRGFNLSDYDAGVFDEAIPEPHEIQRRGEGLALLNAIETINRNRERDGRRPFQMYLLANSNTLNSRILAETGDASIIQQMQARGQTFYDTPTVTIWIFEDSPISAWKRTQNLYKGQKGRFADMALDNRFSEDTSLIKAADLRQYKPRAVLGDMAVWRSRQDETLYHVTAAGACRQTEHVRHFTDDARGRKECRAALPFLASAYTRGKVTFDDYSLKFNFEDFIY